MERDMYLYAKKFMMTDWQNQEKQQEEFANNPLLADLKEAGIKPQLRTISIEAGYWWKVNHIHQWFVLNVQSGQDDCGTYHVDREQLEELKEDCQKVLLVPSLAQELLPTQEGFFFGGTEYDDNYMNGLRQTIEIVDECLKYPAAGWDFEYRSSW